MTSNVGQKDSLTTDSENQPFTSSSKILSKQNDFDRKLYGGDHRRFYPVDGMLEQAPTKLPATIPALRPAHRPSNTTINHGVFAVYNSGAGEGKQVMTDRMCEGTFGQNKYPLHYAAYKNDLRTVKKLIKKTVWRIPATDVTIADNLKGRTPLHVACCYGHKDIAEALLKDGGANLEAIDHWGWSPLMYAVYSGHETLVRWLVSHRGAYLSVHGNRGETAWTLSQIEHRGFVSQRYALTNFIRTTEDELTRQSAANGWRCTFGPVVHPTRPKKNYKKVNMTISLDGSKLYLHYRVGEFGLKWATRTLNLNRIGRPDDNTSIRWSASTISKTAHDAAVMGHIQNMNARGYGKPSENWIDIMDVGNTALELVCAGGNVVVRNDEEEVLDQNGVKKPGDNELESVCLELPIPPGLHISFIIRMLEDIVRKGKERGRKDWQRELDEMKAARKPSFLKKMSMKIFGRGKSVRRERGTGYNNDIEEKSEKEEGKKGKKGKK